MSIGDGRVSNEITPDRLDPGTRRRGAVLETALLDAAWEELTNVGFGRFTIEGVATRSGTSRTVIYRRWATRPQLALAAMRHYWEAHPVAVPDTGNLRDDLITYLSDLLAKRGDLAGFFLGTGLQQYFEETHTSLGELREEVIRSADFRDELYDRAIERGEIDPQKLTPRVKALPANLMIYEYFLTRKPVPQSVIAEIIDQIFLPLVRF